MVSPNPEARAWQEAYDNLFRENEHLKRENEELKTKPLYRIQREAEEDEIWEWLIGPFKRLWTKLKPTAKRAS